MKTRKAMLDENTAQLRARKGPTPSWVTWPGAICFDVVKPDAVSGFYVGQCLDDDADLRVMCVDFAGAWVALSKAPAKRTVRWWTNRLAGPVNEHTFTGKRVEGYEATTAKRWPEEEIVRRVLRRHSKIIRGLAKA